jgi:chemosensory pili system protein ChpA (sensor histidine kinase/response regulator)
MPGTSHAPMRLQRAAARTDESGDDPVSHAPDRSARGSVLVACLDEDTSEICHQALQHAGYDVRVAEHPDVVLRLARDLRPDLIITSYPTYTSLGVPVATLVRHDPRLRRIPVLSLASWTDEKDLAAASANGVSESLPMPVLLSDLVEVVDRLVRRAEHH